MLEFLNIKGSTIDERNQMNNEMMRKKYIWKSNHRQQLSLGKSIFFLQGQTRSKYHTIIQISAKHSVKQWSLTGK